MAMGKDEGPHMSICNPCVEKTTKYHKGRKQKNTRGTVQTVSECFHLYAHRGCEQPQTNRDTQGMYILPTDENSLMLTEMLANRDCQQTMLLSGHVYLHSSTAYSASREGT